MEFSTDAEAIFDSRARVKWNISSAAVHHISTYSQQ